MPAGRPSNYREEFCEQIIEKAKQGKNMYRIAADWEVSWDSLNDWTHNYPKFYQAYTRARSIQNADLIEKVVNGMGDPKFNGNTAKLVLTHVCRLADQRNLKVQGIGDGGFAEKGKALFKAIDKGSISADELQKVSNAIGTLAKVDEMVKMQETFQKEIDELKGKLLSVKEGNDNG